MKINTMLGSSNSYFKQSKRILRDNRIFVYNLLMLKYGYNKDQIEVYLKAYDYFCENKNTFDGSTFSKDLYDIPQLDLDAMLHDWFYIFYNVKTSFQFVAMADDVFKHEMLMKNKNPIYIYWKLFLLKIIRPIFVIYSKITKPKMESYQIDEFLTDCNILTNEG